MSPVQIAACLAIAFGAIATAAKLIRIARMPVHLRWDLYPIPHEKGRGAYGGSYYEEVDWWTKPRQYSLIAELRAMAVEIFFVHSLFRHNRALWLASYPFHIGLYCLVAFGFFLSAGAGMEWGGTAVVPGGPSVVAAAVFYATLVTGVAGWVLTSLGALGLLVSRLVRSDLRQASVRSDYFNLLFLLAASLAGFLAWAAADSDFAVLRGFVRSTLTFGPAGELPVTVALQVWLTAALVVYFPFTHMTHMFSKFFTYHSVRWEDQPNIRGGRIEKAVSEALGRPITWSAPHITKTTWAGAAADTKKTGHE